MCKLLADGNGQWLAGCLAGQVGRWGGVNDWCVAQQLRPHALLAGQYNLTVIRLHKHHNNLAANYTNYSLLLVFIVDKSMPASV
jgi:hypothetical protein